MYLFIDMLKVIAAICITNSHFANVWPISAIASGGMLGNVLFFAISGFGLYRSNLELKNLTKWYFRRIRRIYITVWIVSSVTFLASNKGLDQLVKTFIYPTDYHFIASIMVLYIIFYLIIWFTESKRIHISVVNIIYFAVVFVIYIFFYDKSVNHIDVVEEPFIRFLFLGAMLLGAQFKTKIEERWKKKKKTIPKIVICLGCTVIYFISKIVVSNSIILLEEQIITWITILLALYSWLVCFGALEDVLQRLPEKVKKVIHEMSKRTLQIYLVQFIIIKKFEMLNFPLDLFVIVTLIILAAEVVYRIDYFIQKKIDCFLTKKR